MRRARRCCHLPMGCRSFACLSHCLRQYCEFICKFPCSAAGASHGRRCAVHACRNPPTEAVDKPFFVCTAATRTVDFVICASSSFVLHVAYAPTGHDFYLLIFTATEAKVYRYYDAVLTFAIVALASIVSDPTQGTFGPVKGGQSPYAIA